MKTINISLTLFLIFFSTLSFAQNELDAYRHSQTQLRGSARMLGMGGAYSAAGADIGATTLNPASLGLFRSSAFTLTPTFSLGTVEGQFINQAQNGRSNYFGIPNWGMAFTTVNYYDEESKRKSGKKIKSYSFAFGHNQTENYHSNSLVQDAFNEFSSITNNFAEQAQGIPFSELENLDSRAGLALRSLMIEVIADRFDSVDYYGAADRGMINQTVQIEETGKRNEWFAGIGANMNDKFFIGASINLERLRYEQRFDFAEEDVNEMYEFLDNQENNGFPLEIPFVRLIATDTFSTSGLGFGATVGLIYRPIDQVRLSFSAQTPTIYTLTDRFDNIFTTVIQTTTGTEELQEIPLAEGEFNYNLTTPFRATGGLMILIKKYGFISADVEYVDYSSSRLSSTETNVNNPGFVSFSEENAAILNDYTSTVNIRIGGEARFDMFRLRLGAARYGSGLSNDLRQYLDDTDLETIRTIDNNRIFLTGGIGIRQRNFFADVSLVNMRQQNKVTPYTLDNPDAFQPTFVTTRITNNISGTIGFLF
ncbi:MAG: hypothetical protein MRZ79_04205 [Bacteroidia bacterium]|nr:hypothetical protein [Bacteroidia bacterium]